jgi:hypothetical protein
MHILSACILSQNGQFILALLSALVTCLKYAKFGQLF